MTDHPGGGADLFSGASLVGFDLTDLVDKAPCGYLVLGSAQQVLAANSTLLEWLSRNADDVVGRSISTFLSVPSRLFFGTHLAPLLAMTGRIDEVALELMTASGARWPVLASARRATTADGSSVDLITVFDARQRRTYERDLLEARRAAAESADQARLAAQEVVAASARLSAIFEQSPVGLAEIGWDGTVLAANSAMCGLMRLPRAVLVGLRPMLVKADPQGNLVENSFAELPDTQVERTLLVSDGSRLPVLVHSAPIATSSGSDGAELVTTSTVVTVIDATALLQQVTKLRAEVRTDPLTGLPNRAAWLERAETDHALGGVVIAVDLNGFKYVNDHYGHDAGDEVLKAVARRLQECVRGDDLVARLGGDEFAIHLVGTEDSSRASDRCRQLQVSISQPVYWRGVMVQCQAAVGWSAVPVGDLAAALHRADANMYRDKRDAR